MKLDSWLVARLARELDESLRGARIQAISVQPQAVVFFCYRRGGDIALHARLDSSAPMLATYQTERPKDSGSPGWLGDVAGLLRGATFDGVAPIPDDRVIVAEVSSRSAFGVPSRTRIVFELQPRKANAIVLRQARDETAWVIVAAAKRFSAGAKRNVVVANAYEPPPPRRATLDRARFIVAARSLPLEDVREWERALSAFDPGCTPALAREVLYRIAQERPAEPAHAAIAHWTQLRSQVEAALEAMGPVFAWYEDDELVACHLIELQWPGVTPVTGRSLTEWCARALLREPAIAAGTSSASVKKRLSALLARAEDEATRLRATLAEAARAEELREAGETIYAHLAQIEPGSARFENPEGVAVALDPTLTAKQNAAQYFRRYRKAKTGSKAMRERLDVLARNREHWEQLVWEADRTDLELAQKDVLLADIAEDIGMQRRQRKVRRARARERAVDLGEGAVAYVGRSPKENERLTFTVAGPNDLWFHARGIPGAHIVLKTAGVPPAPAQIREAAKLAAAHSKAAGSSGVEVDYTQRKHVRRRGAGGTGQVFYTHFSTVRVDG